MKPLAIASRVARILLWIIEGVVLLALGVLLTLYSPWGQSWLRGRVVSALNATEGTEVRLDDLRLRFPLKLDIAGLALVQNGDTMVSATSAKADVALAPLLKGDVEVRALSLADARYQMGNADSAMMLVITAQQLSIEPARVKLSPLAIDITDGVIEHGRVSLLSRVDTSKVAPDTVAEAQPLRIEVERLKLADFTYEMKMLPTIDSLGVNVADGTLRGGLIDIKGQTVSIASFTGTGLDAAYIAPDSAQIAQVPVVPPSPVTTPPWTVTVDSIHFSDSRGLYTTHGLEPLPGLDFAYIQADSMDITVHDFYNQATTLTLPIELKGVERCGVRLAATGTFAMDSAAMRFSDFDVALPYSHLWADGMLGVGDLLTDPSLPLALRAAGDVGVPDARLMFPAFKPYLAGFAQSTPIDIDVDLSGVASDIDVRTLDVNINHCVHLRANGQVQQAFSPRGPEGDITLSGNIVDVNSLMKAIASGSGVTVPPMKLNGHVAMHGGNMRGKLDATTIGGKLALSADFKGRSENYDFSLSTDRFPVNAFMKDLGVGRVSATAHAAGNGLDLLKPTANLDARVDVHSLEYSGYDYRDITLDASLHDGEAHIVANSDIDDAQATIKADGNLNGDLYKWEVTVDGRHIDLQALHLSPDPGVLTIDMQAAATIAPATKQIDANATIKSLTYVEEVADYELTGIRADFASCDTLTTLSITNRDFIAHAATECGLDTLMSRFALASEIVRKQLDQRHIDVDSIQPALPQFTLYASGGHNNFINDILGQSDMRLRRFDMKAANDSTISLDARALGLSTSTIKIDTIGVDLTQLGNRMQLTAKVDNRPGTLDAWAHVRLDALLNTNQIALRASQRNNEGKTGYDLGAIATFADSTVVGRIFPLSPVIAYQPWKVNFDNYIQYNFPEHKVQANLRMKSDKSSLALYTVEPTDSAAIAANISDVVLKIGDIHIAEWISINPFAPPIDGSLSADLRLKWNGHESINADGQAQLDDFYYDKQRVGTFVTNIDVNTNLAGMIKAKADLSVDGAQVALLNGVLNDSTATTPFDLDLDLIKFPLSVANPFLPDGMAQLSGTLNGSMCVMGDAKAPVLNGEIYFDAAALRLKMTNTSYAFSDVKIPVEQSVVKFNDFTIKGANDNPLAINGTVDMRQLTAPRFDLGLSATNMMVVNTDRASRGADIYGKAFIDLNAAVKGSTRFMSVKANLTVDAGTNVTYVLSDATSTLKAPSETDMVKFVNFNDSLDVIKADSVAPGMLMAIDATLNIQNGTTITVNLSTTNRDRVQIQPEGQVTYTQTPISEGRLTGRINLNGGFARYTLPVISSEKYFTIDEGSYIAFNGDMLDPVLNLHATDALKANVTVEGQNSRLVNFNILLGVTGTLDNMDVKFDLTTNDDMTVANELQSMSPEQRANQAMNMLLYNVYTGPGTRANANLAVNPLYSFIESQVNNWAANNIKGVDLTFGIDQYNQTTNGNTSTAMTYSYQVSKSLFNDRFKIVVGGNYSTDDNADENLSENLINDISFEYYLNQKRTMLLKIFRHTGFESILEGEVTQTGVGFVYKRRLSRLSDMLPRFMRPRNHKKVDI